jgi:antitoxin Phd
MKTWQVEDAKTHLGELLDVSLKDGPQVVARRGVDAAVLVPIEEWRRLQRRSQPTLRSFCLALHRASRRRSHFAEHGGASGRSSVSSLKPPGG